MPRTRTARAEAGVRALDRVHRVDHLADLGVVGEKGHELRPRRSREREDRGVLRAQRAAFDPRDRRVARAHVSSKIKFAQARHRLDQIEQAALRWSHLERLAQGFGWPDRLVIALEQAWAAE
jgi:hypothetical protein